MQLLTNRGVVRYRLGQGDEAIADFRRALEIDPGAREATESLAIATRREAPPPSPQTVAPATDRIPLPVTLAPTILP